MTTSTTLSVTYVEPGPLTSDDPRLALAHATQVARAVVARVGADVADRPTPCGDWDVLTVARHLIGVFRRVAAAPSGAPLDDLPVVPDIALDELDDALGAVAGEVHAAWTEPITLDQIIQAPWGPTPGAACLLVWTADVLTHAWDLTSALGLDLEWPPETAQVAEVMRAGLPATGRDELPFGEVVEVAEDAPPIERLVGWTGRDPATA